ncbi:hypothetical protein D3C78_1937370 [compost metagenome]
MSVDTKLQCIGRAAEPLGQQAAQKDTAEQILPLAIWLPDLLPMTLFLQGELARQRYQLVGVDLSWF